MPFADIHTLLGNAHGMPCALPFKYNNKWYYECTAEGRDDHLLWCATSTHYDDTKKWGFCPVQGEKNEQISDHSRIRVSARTRIPISHLKWIDSTSQFCVHRL